MESSTVLIFSAFWLGLLTSVSPCPLATNIAAVSFVGKELSSTRKACLAGILYTIGRSLTYTIIAVIVAKSMLSVPILSDFLQRQINSILGPLLIVVGMVLLQLIDFNIGGGNWLEKIQRKVAAKGLLGSFLLGVLFAASFCPLSAAIFFGSLIPLSIKAQSVLLIPTVYGIGSGVPVLGFSLLITFGLGKLGSVYGRVTALEKYARIVTGAIFVLVGLYYSLVYIFGVI